jgi:hypothetical protein
MRQGLIAARGYSRPDHAECRAIRDESRMAGEK